MTQSRLVCYIDEAGCSGEQYTNGSSHFLAIGAVVFDRSQEANIIDTFREARAERERGTPFKKFSKSSETDNFVLTKIMASKPLRIAQVALHKPSMAGTYTRSHHLEEYQYLCKFAIERVSWIARDSAITRGIPNTKCQLIFSEQTMYPYDSICAYLNKLKSGRQHNSSIEWDYIDTKIGYMPHEDEHPIHLADIAASALHKAIEPKKHGMTDDRFQRNLGPAIYRKYSKPYGIKLFPRKEIAELKAQGQFGFLDIL